VHYEANQEEQDEDEKQILAISAAAKATIR
jgi:hypothetical protein